MLQNIEMENIQWELVLWLSAAFLSLVLSVALWFLIDQLTGIFVGLWVPSILSFGALVRKGN
ncbi:MAG: hypothetical protein ACJ0A3_01125 [Dehalococcoidia bacterium]